MLDLDEYETELLQSVENGEWQSRDNIDERMKELQSFVKNQKKKAISIRVGENDKYEQLSKIKRLYDDKVLTKEEFLSEKKKILDD